MLFFLYKVKKFIHNITGDYMENISKDEYKKIVQKHTPKEDRLKNGITVFIAGGIMGVLAQLLMQFYVNVLNLASSEASVLVIITFIVLACILTGFGVFDKLVRIFKSALLIPITGFAHAMMSSAMEYRKEGLVTGIGSNIFKLTGTVILYGVVSAYFFGMIRYFIMGA